MNNSGADKLKFQTPVNFPLPNKLQPSQDHMKLRKDMVTRISYSQGSCSYFPAGPVRALPPLPQTWLSLFVYSSALTVGQGKVTKATVHRDGDGGVKPEEAGSSCSSSQLCSPENMQASPVRF